MPESLQELLEVIQVLVVGPQVDNELIWVHDNVGQSLGDDFHWSLEAGRGPGKTWWGGYPLVLPLPCEGEFGVQSGPCRSCQK
jgi:hypothetical protein